LKKTETSLNQWEKKKALNLFVCRTGSFSNYFVMHYEVWLLNNGAVLTLPGNLWEWGASFLDRTRLNSFLCINWFVSELCLSVTVMCCPAVFLTRLKIEQ
jgi:hypothetical protein